MFNLFRVGALCTIVALLSACATVTRSSRAAWSVTSDPIGAQVATTTGGGCAETPCSIVVNRKDRFSATVSMDGFHSQTVDVKPTLSSEGAVAFLGNAIIGGLLGASIDIYTGAALDPSPNSMVVSLNRNPRADGTPSCTQERMAYARQVGVPCAALGQKVDLGPYAIGIQRP